MEEGPRTITIERRWAIGSVVATFVLVVAMAVAIIVVVADGSNDERGIPDGGPAIGFQSGGMPPGISGDEEAPTPPGAPSAPTP